MKLDPAVLVLEDGIATVGASRQTQPSPDKELYGPAAAIPTFFKILPLHGGHKGL